MVGFFCLITASGSWTFSFFRYCCIACYDGDINVVFIGRSSKLMSILSRTFFLLSLDLLELSDLSLSSLWLEVWTGGWNFRTSIDWKVRALELAPPWIAVTPSSNEDYFLRFLLEPDRLELWLYRSRWLTSTEDSWGGLASRSLLFDVAGAGGLLFVFVDGAPRRYGPSNSDDFSLFWLNRLISNKFLNLFAAKWAVN